MKDYIEFDFDQFTPAKGLKKFLTMLAKQGYKAVSVNAPNKPKRSRNLGKNITTKFAKITVTGGQTFSLEIKKEEGGVGIPYKLKIGSRVLPIKHTDDMGKAVREITMHLKRGQPAYDKMMKRKAAKILNKVDIPKPLKQANKKILQTLQGVVTEVSSKIDTLRDQIREKMAVIKTKDETLESLKATYEELIRNGSTLQSSIGEME